MNLMSLHMHAHVWPHSHGIDYCTLLEAATSISKLNAHAAAMSALIQLPIMERRLYQTNCYNSSLCWLIYNAHECNIFTHLDVGIMCIVFSYSPHEHLSLCIKFGICVFQSKSVSVNLSLPVDPSMTI